MEPKGLELNISGWGSVRLMHALFDLNGTLALDGDLSPGVRERLLFLQDYLTLHLITADTHGTAEKVLQGCGDLTIVRIQAGNEAFQKGDYLEKVGSHQAVAFGNGRNDTAMLRRARLGICVMNGEGTAVQAILAGDLVVRSAVEGLDLLLKPDRLRASLRC